VLESFGAGVDLQELAQNMAESGVRRKLTYRE
jgi:hypothetical protein